MTTTIRVVLTDVDGVLTDAGMYYSEAGDELKKFNTRDGMGVARLQQRGVVVGIVTGEDTEIVSRRAEKLNIKLLHQGVSDKLPKVKQISKELGIPLSEFAYIGDDLNDLEVLKAVGFSAAPADAEPAVKSCVDYCCERSGGSGVFREFAEIIISKMEA